MFYIFNFILDILFHFSALFIFFYIYVKCIFEINFDIVFINIYIYIFIRPTININSLNQVGFYPILFISPIFLLWPTSDKIN